MDRFIEIDNMKNRMIKGCAVECSGACGDCSRTGEPLNIKGKLYLATGELEVNKICSIVPPGQNLYIVASDCDKAKAAPVYDDIKEKMGGKAFCFASDEYSVEEGKLFNRMADLKDEENISLRPSACAGFEGLRQLVAPLEAAEAATVTCEPDARRGFGVPAPDEDSVVVVWALDGAEASLDEMLDYYEKAKRM